MTRYIDADALIDAYCNGCTHYRDKICRSAQRCDFESFCNEYINTMPTVDAVPVVRCYECKYFTEFEKGFASDWDGSCRYWNTHSTVYSNFCGCGARMDEE